MKAPMTCRTPVFFLNNRGAPECLTDAPKAVSELAFLPSYLLATEDSLVHGDHIVETEIGRVRVPRGWLFAGWAEVTLHMVDRDRLIAGKVRALEGEADQIGAEAQARITEIRRKISTLLAIEHTPQEGTD